MRRLLLRAPRGSLLALAAASLLFPNMSLAAPPGPPDKAKIPAVRWDEGRPGCTFSRSDDGYYHYGLIDKDLVINVAIDAQELEKVHRRHEPFFAVLLNLRYNGKELAGLHVERISLEFADHFHTVQTTLDPDAFAQKVQNDSDELDHATAREIGKHPEEKESKEAYMRAFLKDSAELQEFIGKNSLRVTELGPGNPDSKGWVLFSTSNKWIGRWKKQENLILRVPFAGTVYEFPFQLPPKPADTMLRKRP